MTWSERLYSALLHLYPASFRERYGDAMLEFHRDRVREARLSGESLIALWFRTLVDVTSSSLIERARSLRGRSPVMDVVRQDVHYALRSLRRRPGFALVTISTLALGLGINAAIFSVAYGILLRPLAYADADRVVAFQHEAPQWLTSEPEFLDYQRELRSFSGLAAFTRGEVTLSSDENPERLRVARVSEGFFEVLGVPAALGRVFGSYDHEAPFSVVILSERFWNRRFDRDSGIVGRTIPINGASRTVIGIMPPGFDYPEAQTDLWTPMPKLTASNPGDRTNHFLWMVGRLAPGATLASARQDASALARRFVIDHAGSYDPAQPPIPDIDRVRETATGSTRPFIIALFGASSLVLLIACANIANLLLARGEARQREMTIRGALGASQGRLLRQSMTESLLLAAISGALGLGVAWLCTDALVRFAPASLPRIDAIVIDWRAAVFTMAVALVVGAVVGQLPAWRASAQLAMGALKSEGRQPGANAQSTRTRRVLVVAEVAIAVLALSGTGMLVRSLRNLEGANLGFLPAGVVTAKIALQASAYDDARASLFFDELLARLNATPGVVRAAASGWRPVVEAGGLWGLLPEDRADPTASWPLAEPQQVTPGYFSTIGIAVVRGRDFDRSDQRNTPLVAVVSKRMAETVWPAQDPLGRRFKLGGTSPWVTVVGVVDDIRARGLADTPGPTMYFPYAQTGLSAYGVPRTMAVFLRTSGDPESFAPTLRAVVRELDRQVPVSDVRTLEEIVATSVSTRRFSTGLIAAFGSLALLLAALGTYGVMAYGVAQRTFEIGVRMALGASEHSVLGQVLREGIVLCLVGLGLGLAASLGLRQVIGSMLVGVEHVDVPTLTITSFLLLAASLCASLVPAIRAARVNPVEALRSTSI